MINSKKILLENERTGSITKRLNRLSKWNFYQVLNRTGMFKVFLINFMVLILLAPIIYLVFDAIQTLSVISANLPSFGSFVPGTGYWVGVDEYLAQQTLSVHKTTLLWSLLGALPLMFALSGMLAVIRDAFWTGSLTIFRSFARGVKANILYALISTALISGMVFGLFHFYWWSSAVLAGWLSILLTVLLSIVALIVTVYLFILCSVTVTYKQSVGQNLADAWRLLWLNIIPNILNFIITCVPVLLYIFMPQSLQFIVLMFLLLWGAFWVVFVWQTHMMKTFALFHPVVVNKKGEPKGNVKDVKDIPEEKFREYASAPSRKDVVEHYKQTRKNRIENEKNRKNEEQNDSLNTVNSNEVVTGQEHSKQEQLSGSDDVTENTNHDSDADYVVYEAVSEDYIDSDHDDSDNK